jgi:cytochrome c-type biogenesis protein CcmH/NrfG
LAAREKVATVGGDEREIIDKERASENFEAGLTLLMDGEAEASIPFLARAAHFAPRNPRHRAYYGKALATDGSQRHKAESEIQAAIQLDPDNLNFKLMLAEFFIQFNLLKRAEGELSRLLAVYPSNREARQMLENLQNK